MTDPFSGVPASLMRTLGRDVIYTATQAYPADVRSVRAILRLATYTVGLDGPIPERRWLAEFATADIPPPRAGDTVQVINGALYTVDRVDGDNGYLTSVWLR
jgi:hypothetical protein